MHKFLRATGLLQLHNNAETDQFIYEKVLKEENLEESYTLPGGSVLSAYRLSCGENLAFCVITERFPSGREQVSYYYPELFQNEISSKETCTVELHTERESFGGFIDDYKLGISLIFFISNPVSYLRNSDQLKIKEFNHTFLSGFSVEGSVLLPIEKKLLEENAFGMRQEEKRLMEAAREGDEKAIEILTEADMDTYSEVMKRVENEDLYSIVESSCIPSGVECDLYSVLGEILTVKQIENTFTGETVYVMQLNCNDVIFPMAIAAADLCGVPEMGRRFKGKVYLQGRIDFDAL